MIPERYEVERYREKEADCYYALLFKHVMGLVDALKLYFLDESRFFTNNVDARVSLLIFKNSATEVRFEDRKPVDEIEKGSILNVEFIEYRM